MGFGNLGKAMATSPAREKSVTFKADTQGGVKRLRKIQTSEQTGNVHQLSRVGRPAGLCAHHTYGERAVLTGFKSAHPRACSFGILFPIEVTVQTAVEEVLSDIPLSPRKQEINLPCEGCPPCTRRYRGILTPELGIRAQKAVGTSLATPY